MNTPELTSALGFGTLIIALLVTVFLLLRFLRKPENRHPMDGQPERNIQQIRDDAEHGSQQDQFDEHRTRN